MDDPAHGEPAAPTSRSVASNAAPVLIGSIIHGATQLGIVLITARRGSVEDVGTLALAYAICGPIFLFLGLDLRAAQASDVTTDHTLGDYLRLRLVTSSVALVTATALGWILLGPNRRFAMIAAVAFAKTTESMSTLLHGHFERHERLDLVGMSTVLRGLIQVTAFAILFTGSERLVPATVALALGGIGAVALDSHLIRVLPRTWTSSRQSSWRLLRATTPLGTAALVQSTTENLPRYLIEVFRGTRTLGLYAALADAARLLRLVGAALHRALVPRLASPEGGRGDYRHAHRVAGVVNALALAAAAAVGTSVVGALFGEQYVDRLLLVLVVAAAAAVVHLGIAVAPLVADRRFGSTLVVRAAAFGGVATSGLVLVPTIGSEGAALAALVGACMGLTVATRLMGADRRLLRCWSGAAGR